MIKTTSNSANLVKMSYFDPADLFANLMSHSLKKEGPEILQDPLLLLRTYDYFAEEVSATSLSNLALSLDAATPAASAW